MPQTTNNFYNEPMVTRDATNALSGLYNQSKLGQQNFGPNDSTIASSINHPITAIHHALKWIEDNMHTAAGMPQQNPDESSPYQYAPSGEQQAQAGVNLAGTAQLGGMPGAPQSAGGTVGTMTYPIERPGPITVPRNYMPVGQPQQGPMIGTLSRGEQNNLTGALQQQSPMRGYIRKGPGR